MEGRRNDDRAKPQRSGTDDGYLKAKHVSNQTRPDDDYLNPKPNTRTDNGYLELGNVTDENRPDGGYIEIRHLNNDTIGDSVKYDIIDYDLLKKNEPRQDQHTYRGLKFDANDETRKDTTAPHRSDKVEIRSSAEHKRGGNRVFILIIVVLAVLLVAMAATVGILYTGGFFDKDGSSSTTSTTTSSATTTTTSTQPPTTTINASTTSTTTSSATTTTTSTQPPTTTINEGVSIEERCQSYDGLIPHPSECQAYYNCSDTKVLPPLTNFEPFLNECPYPQLFNIETMTCEHFEDVECGERLEAKDGCDYRAIKCDRQPCLSCAQRYPKCKGKDDGFNVHDVKPWSPYYIICYKERFVAEKECPRYNGSLIQLFSPEYNGCVPLDRIPQEHGGTMPSCIGKADGSNVHDDKLWSPYYIICYKERFITESQCPTNPDELFSPDYNGCVTLDRIPQEHGGTGYTMLPSCIGKADGSNVHDDKPWSPYYIICYKERFITESQCPTNPVELFSPDYNGCVTLDRIPQEHGGTMPSCIGKADGSNVHDDKPWSPYYIICYKERFITESQCPTNPVELFSPEYNACVTLDRIPQEHGGTLNASCIGKEDGLNMHDDKPWSPYYIICYKERFITESQCPTNPVELFSPEYNACVTLDRIPQEHGGTLNASCIGKEDGLNMHDDKPWSPYYIICYKDHFVAELRCPLDPNGAIHTQLFSPEYGGCASIEQIPREHGGYKANCTGKEDGRHPNNYRRCNHYMICAFGQYLGFEACPSGTAFNEDTNTCTSYPNVCECLNNC